MDPELRSSSLQEKRRRYFEKRDKHLSERKGFRKIEVASPSSGPQFLMVLLCVLGIALALYQIFGRDPFASEGDQVMNTFNGAEGESEPSSGVRIRPDGLKDEIAAVESALLDPQVDSLEQMINSTSFEVGLLIRALKRDPDQRKEAAASELEVLSQDLSTDLDLEGIQRFKQDWLRFRDRNFQKAAWFHSGTGDALGHRVALAVYRGVADDLLQHVGQGIEDGEAMEQEASRVGTLDIHQATRDQLMEEWRGQAQTWNDELERLTNRAPDNRDSIPATSIAAVQQLKSALRDARGKLPTDRFPTAADMTMLEGVLLKAQLAVEALAETR